MNGFDVYSLIYTFVFLISFVICYFVVMFINVEKIFKQGSIWPIRIFQVIISLIMAYFIAQGIQSLITAFQF